MIQILNIFHLKQDPISDIEDIANLWFQSTLGMPGKAKACLNKPD